MVAMIYNWLELRSGLEGPVLTENYSAYSLFSDPDTHPMALAIGGKVKSEYLSVTGQSAPKSAAAGISFHQLRPSLTVVDCGLHNVTKLRRIHVQPRSAVAKSAHHRLRTLSIEDDSPQQISAFSQDLYWRLLVPFTSAILLFSDDLGGITGLSSIVARWSQQAFFEPLQFKPKLIIVADDQPISIRLFKDFVASKLIATLRVAEPFKTKTRREVDDLLKRAFGDIQIVSSASEIRKWLEVASRIRQRAGFAFRGRHLKFLLRQALIHFAENRSHSFDFCLAARCERVIPVDHGRLLTEFVNTIQGTSIDQTAIIASALHLDAYPPGMHFFPPDLTFDKFYALAVSSMGPGAPFIRSAFISMFSEEMATSTSEAHLRLLSKFRVEWARTFSGKVCLVCLADEPKIPPLACGHRLCRSCVVIAGKADVSDPWHYQVAQCPLCGNCGQSLVSLRPPTAGLRVLKLDCPSSSKFVAIQFLKELQALVGLPLCPLREHFDVVIGSGIGAYLAQTLFVEKWKLEDCMYHLPRAGLPKLRGRITGREMVIAYGKGLDWKVDSVTRFNGPRIDLVIKGQTISNSLETTTSGPAASDMVVEFQGGDYSSELIHSIASQMLSYLFYIELLSLPAFHECPSRVYIWLRCRVPAGQALLDLLTRFARRKARLHYRGKGGPFSVATLVSSAALQRCRQGEGFWRILSVSVDSLSAELDLRVDGTRGNLESVSNCPYMLEKLLADQGANCIFGRKDHLVTALQEHQESSGVVLEQVDGFYEALDDVPSWI